MNAFSLDRVYLHVMENREKPHFVPGKNKCVSSHFYHTHTSPYSSGKPDMSVCSRTAIQLNAKTVLFKSDKPDLTDSSNLQRKMATWFHDKGAVYDTIIVWVIDRECWRDHEGSLLPEYWTFIQAVAWDSGEYHTTNLGDRRPSKETYPTSAKEIADLLEE